MASWGSRSSTSSSWSSCSLDADGPVPAFERRPLRSGPPAAGAGGRARSFALPSCRGAGPGRAAGRRPARGRRAGGGRVRWRFCGASCCPRAGSRGWGGRLGASARALPRLAEGCSLVHANTSVILGARLARLPTVVHVREIYPGWGLLWPHLPSAAAPRRRAGRVSEATRAPLGRGRVIHDGLAASPPRPARGAARAALGLPGDAFVVAVLGRISAWKGQEVLARALGAHARPTRSG